MEFISRVKLTNIYIKAFLQIRLLNDILIILFYKRESLRDLQL